LLTDFAGDRAKHGVPPRRAKRRADHAGGQRDELISDDVSLGAERLLQQAALFQVSDQPVRCRQRQRKRFCNFCHRDGFALVGDMANDRECTVQRPVFFRAHHRHLRNRSEFNV